MILRPELGRRQHPNQLLDPIHRHGHTLVFQLRRDIHMGVRSSFAAAATVVEVQRLHRRFQVADMATMIQPLVEHLLAEGFLQKKAEVQEEVPEEGPVVVVRGEVHQMDSTHPEQPQGCFPKKAARWSCPAYEGVIAKHQSQKRQKEAAHYPQQQQARLRSGYQEEY